MIESSGRIDGWKAIGAHFRRDVRTVMRWANERNLPVRRVQGGGSGSVYAFAHELDEWLSHSGEQATSSNGVAAPPAAPPRRTIRPGLIGLGGVLLAGVIATPFVWHTPAPPAAAQPLPSDPEVSAIYLQARADWAMRTADGLHKAVAGFGTVVSRDPTFAPAYAGLADAYLLNREFDAMPEAQAYAQAEGAAKAALAINPESIDAQRALGFIAYYWHHDNAAARSAFSRAVRLDPKNAQTHFWYGNALVDNGDFTAGLKLLDTARLLEPGSRAIQADFAVALWEAGQRDAGRNRLSALARSDPGFVSPHAYLGFIHLVEKDYSGYLAENAIRARLRGDPAMARRNGEERAAFARGGAAALLTLMLDNMAAKAAPTASDASWSALLATLAGDRARVIAILRAADVRGETWGLRGYEEQLFARWRGDREIVGLFNRRKGATLVDESLSRNGTE